MKVVALSELHGTDRDVRCPQGAFRSVRALLAKDGLGFSVHKTFIPKGGPHRWHYTHHLEACYCISGHGRLMNLATWAVHEIGPDVLWRIPC
jgi:L-ectoine synthase